MERWTPRSRFFCASAAGHRFLHARAGPAGWPTGRGKGSHNKHSSEVFASLFGKSVGSSNSIPGDSGGEAGDIEVWGAARAAVMILHMSQNPTRAAFFDVDGTLTTSTSMFRFLAFYLAAMGHPRRQFDEQVRELRAMAAVGCARDITNRAYFANLRGLDAGVVADVARSWFAAELATGGYYHEPTVAKLRRHQERGDHVVLVSGSFPALLHPIAADLGVVDVWCTRPEISRGRYTGELAGPPMIGGAKGDAVLQITAQRGIDPFDCAAYGDHVSDMPLLKAVGKAYVVGGDTALRSAARVCGWRLLPGTPPAPELPLPFPLPRGRTGVTAVSAPLHRPIDSPYTSARYEMLEGA